MRLTKTIFTFFVFCITFNIHAQDNFTSILRNSKYECSSSNRGSLRSNEMVPNFIYDENGEKVFSQGLSTSIFIGGFDENSSFALSGTNYNFSGGDFYQGILSEDTSLPIKEYEPFFTRIWKITASQINQIRTLFQNGNLTISDIPVNILEWPARSNPYILDGELDRDLAPFYDHNQDGVYDPMMGDLPIALEEKSDFIPYEFSYCVYHDLNIHGVTFSNAFPLMIHQIQYMVECTEPDVLHSVMTRLKVEYFGEMKIRNLFMGVHSHVNLGCFANSRFGYNETTSSTYFYDHLGQSLYCDNTTPIPDNISVVRVLVPLNKSFSSSGRFNQPSTPSGTTHVDNGISYYNQLRGLFPAGTAMTYGGNGFDPSSTDTVSYLFPDFPSDTMGWSAEDAVFDDNLPIKNISSIALDDWEEGAVTILDFAEVMLLSETSLGFEIFDEYEDRITQFKADLASVQESDIFCGAMIDDCESGCVWPGDANRDDIVDNEDFLFFAAANVLSGQASSRNESDIIWVPHQSEDWGAGGEGIDQKHADIDGNGILNEGDIRAIKRNFGFKNENYSPLDEPIIENDIHGFSVEHLREEYDAEDDGVSAIINTKVNLGEFLSEFPEGLIGLSFDLDWDRSMVVQLEDDNQYRRFLFDNVIVLDDNGKDLHFEGEDGLILQDKSNFVYLTEDYQAEERGGLLMTLKFMVSDQASTMNADGRDTVYLEFSDIHGMNNKGELVDIGINYIQPLIIYNLKDAVVNIEDLPSVAMNVYPNPSKDLIHVSFNGITRTTDLEITDINGKLIGTYVVSKNDISIDISSWERGIYFIKYVDGRQLKAMKFIKS